MKRAAVYPLLADELSRWRELPADDLSRLAGKPATVRTVLLSGEPVSIEVTLSWANPTRSSLCIEAVANGPSSWRLDRLSESVIVPFKRVL
ncbi:MAG: hypothetical protein LBB55_02610 [Zoogloeaceae bacterium]|jgi:hypothetical protein|nr:hypothetical protein [Zoogloeaceae bacterium]